jgi:hypothetical protein
METTKQKLTRVARELGAAMHQQAGGRWSSLRTAKRDLGDRHVWRFRAGGGDPDRFLLLSHRCMTEGEDPTATVLSQLNQQRWLDRLQDGPETHFRLARGGRLQGRSAN